MKEYWEDTHIMYEDDEDNNHFHWSDFIGGVIAVYVVLVYSRTVGDSDVL